LLPKRLAILKDPFLFERTGVPLHMLQNCWKFGHHPVFECAFFSIQGKVFVMEKRRREERGERGAVLIPTASPGAKVGDES
jgi:hypothetical protein